jgi:hypothetical protein
LSGFAFDVTLLFWMCSGRAEGAEGAEHRAPGPQTTGLILITSFSFRGWLEILMSMGGWILLLIVGTTTWDG